MSYIPFTRPSVDEDTIQAVADVLRSGWLVTGPKVKAFEDALTKRLAGRSVRAFTSATTALEVALIVAGVKPGDEVILPALSFAATANVIVRVGARPVFVDVDLDSRNILVDRIEAAVTPRTRAIMPVHFAGLACDMEAILGIARRFGLRVIEDAAHAIGTRTNAGEIGGFGDIAVFSFHANKNLTTGEGGALVLDDPEETALAELHRFHGIRKDAEGNTDVLVAGGKGNMTDIAAAIGLAQLPRLDAFNARRRTLAMRYFKRLEGMDLVRLPARGDAGHAWHMFAPLLPLDRMTIGRHAFIQAMHRRGIGVGIHYNALPGMTAFRSPAYRDEDFPNAERIGRQTVTLPLFPGMLDDDVDTVCSVLEETVPGGLS